MIELKVTGMTCGGCVSSVKKAIARACPGVVVEVELSSGMVRLDNGSPSNGQPESQGIDLPKITQAIKGAGFGVEGI